MAPPLLRSALLRHSLRPTPFRTGLTPSLRSSGIPATRSYTTQSNGTQTLKNFAWGTACVFATIYGYLTLTDSRSSAHQYIVIPLVRYIWHDDPEMAHKFSLESVRACHDLGVGIRERRPSYKTTGLETTVFGHPLASPIAISAGLDKHGESIDPLLNTSPATSILEIGCITPKPQPGNPQPRMFRLPTSDSLINRYGFNSIGADSVAVRLRARVQRYAILNDLTEQAVLDGVPGKHEAEKCEKLPASLIPGKILGVQIGKNKWTEPEDMEAVKKDYLYCVDRLGPYADFLVVNVSSPNTPGLRSLQAFEPLSQLLASVVNAANKVPKATKPPVAVKVSPDSDTDDEIRGVILAARAAGVKAIIVANTTVSRPETAISSPKTTEEEQRIVAEEVGGYSGPGLKDKMVQLVGRYDKMMKEVGVRGDIDIWASGGITSGQDAYEARKAGASVVMGYTGQVYKGVGWAGIVERELAEIERKEREGARKVDVAQVGKVGEKAPVAA
ncbi:FMN-linked oxidoreductase [Ascobolus immersus RN42]|uniref:FMN-linked oxidoreductase n=1 Tax=Ascobolus immersus RN42 TaxID=1160509 RepID=A0A3N4IBA5_ASCIM|nr:FMN-linked oxidoreductase [Ascobolus immersus RN42]